MEQLSLFIFYNFMFGTEKVICPKNSDNHDGLRGGWSGFGTALVWIDPNYFGSLCSNPNKIQTNDMVGGVMYFCRTSLRCCYWELFQFVEEKRKFIEAFLDEGNCGTAALV